MALVRWEPFRSRDVFPSLFDLPHNMNHLFENFFERDEDSPVAKWSPRVEVTELDDHFEVSAELPGMKREDIKVELNDRILTISGEKQTEHEKKDRSIHLCERIYGSFHRSFRLPSQVKADKINAEFKNGVLKLNLPKVEEAKPKQIAIKVD